MPGSATLDPDVLIDSLVGTIDTLRDGLQIPFGTRAFRVYTIERVWASGIVGDGSSVDTVTEITPRPLVQPFDSINRDMRPCGWEHAGGVKITEVSLSYTQAELLACAPPEDTEYFIRVDEAYGQSQASKWFGHARPPYPDRIKDIGWVLMLELIKDEC